jgi:SanA protein
MHKMSNFRRFFRNCAFALLGFGAGLLAISNLWINAASSDRFLSDPGQAPEGAIGIVLGISEFHPETGKPTDVYHPRLDAAARLASGGRLSALVVSGTPEQSETMRAELLRRGVTLPIHRDPHGLRTLDSVARAVAHFPGRPLVFVSQEWHVRRALWQAERMGCPSLGFAAPEGEGLRARVGGPARDVLAKAKAVIDWIGGFRLSTDVPPGSGNR